MKTTNVAGYSKVGMFQKYYDKPIQITKAHGYEAVVLS